MCIFKAIALNAIWVWLQNFNKITNNLNKVTHFKNDPLNGGYYLQIKLDKTVKNKLIFVIMHVIVLVYK